MLPGFSMLEIMVVVLIIGSIMAVAIPSINALTGAELRRSTGMLQGLCRDTYAKAALSGDSHRIVFDLEKNVYWVERSQGGAVVKRQLIEKNKDGYTFLDPTDERLDGVELDTKDEEERTKIALFKHPEWARVAAPGEKDQEEMKPQKLPGGCDIGENDGCVRFASVWVDHLKEPALAGQVAMVFFPGGFSQEAHIVVTDDDEAKNTLTLEVLPLTGEVYVHNDPIEVPKVER